MGCNRLREIEERAARADVKEEAFPGFARYGLGFYSRCPGCNRLLGHGTPAIREGDDWWHKWCWDHKPSEEDEA